MNKFSVIMTVYDSAQELEDNLPAFLTQEYEQGGYEVIVVDESSTDNTGDVLKRLRSDYPHLYSTFLPRPNRLVSRKKMAFSIGAKAAKHEWLLLTSISKKPAASDVLQAISSTLDESADVTLGYIGRKGIRLQPFATLDDVRRHIVRSERILTSVRERKCLHYAWGRYDFIIVRKALIYDLLRLYEQRTSALAMPGLWLSIVGHNLLGRSSTTLLQTT